VGLRYRPDSDGNLRRSRRPSGRAAFDYESKVGRSAGNLDGDELSRGRFELVASNAILLAKSFTREYRRRVRTDLFNHSAQKYARLPFDILCSYSLGNVNIAKTSE